MSENRQVYCTIRTTMRYKCPIDPVGDFHLGFIAGGAGALHPLMALCAELGAIAPLKPARRQITRLQYKFHQAVDGDDMRLAIINLRRRFSVHFRGRF